MGNEAKVIQHPSAGNRLTLDGWSNVLTGLGYQARDKRMAAEFEVAALSPQQLDELYEGNDLAATVVDTVPKEAFREPWTVRVQGTAFDDGEKAKDTAELIANWLDERNLNEDAQDAWSQGRLHGGAAMLLGVDDGSRSDLGKPLNLEGVRSFDFIQTLTPAELEAVAWYDEPTAPRYGDVKYWRIKPVNYSSIALDRDLRSPVIHESRLLMWPGVRVNRKAKHRNHGWGNSVLVRCHEALRDMQTSWGAAAHLLQDVSQAVFKMKDLASLIGGDEEGNIIKRAALIDATRSVARAVLIDSEEEFERKATPLGGLPEMLQQMAIRFAASARMPVTVLMGQSPAGLNATGASDIRWFYDSIAAEQRTTLKQRLNVLLTLIFRAKNGPTGGVEPEKWRINFPSLYQLTELEAADLRLKQAQADVAYVGAGIVLPDEIATSRFGGEAYSVETRLDQEARALMLEEDALEGEAAAANGAVLLGGGAGDPEAVDPSTALNGAQVTAMMEIIQAVAAGGLPRETGVQMITAAFPLDLAQANKIMGEVGRGFTPDPPAATAPRAPGEGDEA